MCHIYLWISFWKSQNIFWFLFFHIINHRIPLKPGVNFIFPVALFLIPCYLLPQIYSVLSNSSSIQTESPSYLNTIYLRQRENSQWNHISLILGCFRVYINAKVCTAQSLALHFFVGNSNCYAFLQQKQNEKKSM